MASNEYTDEELNYFRVCHVATCEIPNGLRDVFKQEWDNRYAASHGNWQDTAKNGSDFVGMEKPTIRNKQVLSNIKNGNTSEWDCTTIFHAIIYSNCISRRSLNPVIKKSVNNLRLFRNDTFAHVADGQLSNGNFQTSLQKVVDAFQDLKLDTTKIEEIKTQSSFPTDELQKLNQLLEKERKQNEEPHPFCCLPPKPSYDPIERKIEVKRIMKQMRRLRNKNPNEVTVCYISGNPGCGKSELARQIGRRFFDAASAASTKQMTFVSTLNASSIDILLQSYTKFAKCLNLDEDSITRIGTAKDLSSEEKVIHLRSLIVSRVQKYSSWLMIVDNVTDLKSICKYLWQAGDTTKGEGQIVFTTQDSRSIPQNGHTYHASLSTGMIESDSIRTLHEISGLDSCCERTSLQVAKSLDFQPLALACAATYVRRVRNTNPSFTWEKYLQKLEDGKREATEKVFSETSLVYPYTMTAAVKISVENETEDVTMKLAFEFLSSVAAEPVSLQYVMSYVMSCTPEEDEDLVAFKISSSSLILFSDETQEIRVHQVIHSCLCTSADASVSKSQLFMRVMNAFSSLTTFDHENIDDVLSSRALVVHFVFLEKNMSEDKLSLFKKFPEMKDILISMGEICTTHGMYKPAKSFYEFALPLFLSTDSIEDARAASVYNKLANVLQQLGQYREAKMYLEKALAMNDDTSHVITLRQLAAIYIHLGEYNTSKECAEKAFKIQGKGNNLTSSASLAATLTCLGKALIYLGSYKEATNQLEKALSIQEEVYSSNHPAFVPTLQNLGNALYEMGKYQQAIDCSQKALDIQNRIFHKTHPALATTYTILSNTLHHMGRYEAALEKMQIVLDIKKENFGRDHPIFAPTYVNLANILLDQGDLESYKNAKRLLEKALEIQKNTFGENHPAIAITLNGLANALIEEGTYYNYYYNFEIARSCLTNALSIEEKAYGKNHPKLATTLSNMGNIKRLLCRISEAETCLKKSLVLQQDIHNENHPAVAKVLNNLAVILIDQEKYHNAKLHLERALSIQESAYGSEHPLIMIVLFNLAQTLSKLGDNESASRCVERAKAMDTCFCSLPKCFGVNLHKTKMIYCDHSVALANTRTMEFYL